ncbi:hypothetical protein BM1_08792 [Bipolaris maydis]|nr:hypothetical protein BM1_08792 [Bipolaris maydis]
MEQTEDSTLHPTVTTLAPVSGSYVVYVTSWRKIVITASITSSSTSATADLAVAFSNYVCVSHHRTME